MVQVEQQKPPTSMKDLSLTCLMYLPKIGGPAIRCFGRNLIFDRTLRNERLSAFRLRRFRIARRPNLLTVDDRRWPPRMPISAIRPRRPMQQWMRNIMPSTSSDAKNATVATSALPLGVSLRWKFHDNCHPLDKRLDSLRKSTTTTMMNPTSTADPPSSGASTATQKRHRRPQSAAVLPASTPLHRRLRAGARGHQERR